ncbi:hypothetical protein OHS18_06695 [Amycolatopsis sp. NBC_00355]|uniref:hypothetical protein n=1 Tax=Amycolatopsis sp. NBC_00355 TaxID=2975957 RepID=UPI002E255365
MLQPTKPCESSPNRPPAKADLQRFAPATLPQSDTTRIARCAAVNEAVRVFAEQTAREG